MKSQQRFKREPIFPFYWKDWKSDPHVAQLSLAERGAYLELLMTLWAEGTLDLDHKVLARICGCELRQFKRIWTKIGDRFLVIVKLKSVVVEDRLAELSDVIDRYMDKATQTLDASAMHKAVANRNEKDLCICHDKVESVRRSRKAYRDRKTNEKHQ